MTPADVQEWFRLMAEAGHKATDEALGRQLGMSKRAMITARQEGIQGHTATRTALAMSALLAGVQPFEKRD